MLDAPPGAFLRWMDASEPVPTPVFLMLLDFLAEMESGTNMIAALIEARPTGAP